MQATYATTTAATAIRPFAVVLQRFAGGGSTVEIATIRVAAMLLDIPTLSCTLEDLDAKEAGNPVKHAICQGALPVGSVEFIQAAMRVRGLVLPEWNCYPPELSNHLHRRVWRSTVAQAVSGPRVFVKPLALKCFTGFVYPGVGATLSGDDDLEDYQALMALPPDAAVWLSEPVMWVSEYRYYIAPDESGKQHILGCARYDQHGEDNASTPASDVVRTCIELLPSDQPYALDIGVLSTGQTAIVELNDSWAIGLYERALKPREYLCFLSHRWINLCTNKPA